MATYAVLGKGWLALEAANWLQRFGDIVGVVPSAPLTVLDPLAPWAQREKVLYESPGCLPNVDVAISIFYNKILKPEFIERHDRVLNLHNAPLPKYRGMRPINWALKNGEREHGVTIHEVTPEIDAGPIISQVRFSIWPEVDEVIDVYDRCMRYGWELFRDTIPRLDKITAVPQDETQATYYSKKDIKRLGERSDWRRSLR